MSQFIQSHVNWGCMSTGPRSVDDSLSRLLLFVDWIAAA